MNWTVIHLHLIHLKISNKIPVDMPRYFAPPQIHGLPVGNCMNIARAATVKYADHIIRLVFSTTSSPINLTLSREYLLISIAALLAGSHTKEHDLDSLTSMAS